MSDSARVSADLLATLQLAHPGADLRYSRAPDPMPGGYFADVLRFALVDPPDELAGELVARIIPVSETWARESVVQRYVADAGVPTPRVRLSAGPDSPLGRGLIVMDLAPGVTPLRGLGPAAIARHLPSLILGLPRVLARISGGLHEIEPGPLDVEWVGPGGTNLSTTTDFVRHQGEIATRLGHPELSNAADRILGSEPAGMGRVICHGDLHPFNLLVDGERVNLIDWTNSRIADPTFDLSFTHLVLTELPIDVPSPVATALGPVARSIGRRFLREYEGRTGTSIDPVAFDWHRRVHALRILVEVASLEGPGSRAGDHPFVRLAPRMRELLQDA